MMGSLVPPGLSNWRLSVDSSRTANYVIRMISGVGGAPREGRPYPDRGSFLQFFTLRFENGQSFCLCHAVMVQNMNMTVAKPVDDRDHDLAVSLFKTQRSRIDLLDCGNAERKPRRFRLAS